MTIELFSIPVSLRFDLWLERVGPQSASQIHDECVRIDSIVGGLSIDELVHLTSYVAGYCEAWSIHPVPNADAMLERLDRCVDRKKSENGFGPSANVLARISAYSGTPTLVRTSCSIDEPLNIYATDNETTRLKSGGLTFDELAEFSWRHEQDWLIQTHGSRDQAGDGFESDIDDLVRAKISSNIDLAAKVLLGSDTWDLEARLHLAGIPSIERWMTSEGDDIAREVLRTCMRLVVSCPSESAIASLSGLCTECTQITAGFDECKSWIDSLWESSIAARIPAPLLDVSCLFYNKEQLKAKWKTIKRDLVANIAVIRMIEKEFLKY